MGVLWKKLQRNNLGFLGFYNQIDIQGWLAIDSDINSKYKWAASDKYHLHGDR